MPRKKKPSAEATVRAIRRKTWYIDPAEIQRDLDRFMLYYNFKRSHQGYRVKGRTPARAFLDGIVRMQTRALSSAPIALPQEVSQAA